MTRLLAVPLDASDFVLMISGPDIQSGPAEGIIKGGGGGADFSTPPC